MPIICIQDNHESRYSFDIRRGASTVIAAIAAVSLLTSCASDFRQSPSEGPTTVYSKWLTEKRRTITISSNIEPVAASYKKNGILDIGVINTGPWLRPAAKDVLAHVLDRISTMADAKV